MQRYDGYGGGNGGGRGRRSDEPSYQTYPQRALTVEKYRPAMYGGRENRDGSGYPRYPQAPYSATGYPPQAAARPEPGYGYQRPVEPQPPTINYWMFRILGLIHIVLAAIIFSLGVTLVAISSSGDAVGVLFANVTTFLYYGFDGACLAVIAPLALTIGILNFLNTPTRRNLEAVRNSGMVLGVVSALLCGSLTIYEGLTHSIFYGLNGVPTEGTAYTVYALWLTLIVFVCIESIAATVSSSYACCVPTCCVPIVNEANSNTFVYTENEPLQPLCGYPSSEYYGQEPPPYTGRF